MIKSKPANRIRTNMKANYSDKKSNGQRCSSHFKAELRTKRRTKKRISLPTTNLWVNWGTTTEKNDKPRENL